MKPLSFPLDLVALISVHLVDRSNKPAELFQLSSGPERFFVGRVAVSEKKQLVGLGLLEEDEEFKEFPAEEWAGLGEDEDSDAHVSEDNWDDDSVEDDFSNQLQPELDKHGYKMETL
ncbi:26S proteasome complex subunit SEM1-like [Panthera pardus]|uniref:26S proteasome complex subunit SEM1 n=1 Tax=Panthera pardus TaxID=9691 RepID=A0A9V1F973_PANPR|nr:26S proteasome complex subunit SEM1-like [Panthera pardus]XP_049510596.1 26S proteasome complex subunit SEM1-like [Panthera uncia]XP_058592144.1 26S proteasome complex subunit SEM1-like [Neofelis nebulosa]